MQKRRTECLVHNQKRKKRSLLHFDKIGGKNEKYLEKISFCFQKFGVEEIIIRVKFS